jgi:hypothetical protein
MGSSLSGALFIPEKRVGHSNRTCKRHLVFNGEIFAGVTPFRSRGQVAILYVIALPVLIACLALCTDVTVMYAQWLHLQRAADAAALAGAGYLPHDVATAKDAAEQFAQTNDTLASEMVGTPAVAPDNMSITVQLKRTVPYYFARVLGLVNQEIQVSATAGITDDANGTSGLMPIALDCESPSCDPSTFAAPGTQVSLKLSQTGPGNWAALALGGNGANTYRSNLQVGYTGTLDTSQPVWTEPGNIVGPTGQAISQRIATGRAVNPGATPCDPQADRYDPRYVAVPIIQFSDANGKSPVMIQNFGNVWIDQLQNNNNSILVTFCGISDPPSPTAVSSANFGLLPPILVK